MLHFLATVWDTGFRLRCPVCEQGKLFKDWFTMHAICPHCSVRFERHEGEVVGGMGISIVATSVIFLVGYVMGEMLTTWSVWVHLAIWVPFAVLFPIGFYRYSRALWVVILYKAGDIYWDQEPYESPELSITDAFLNRTPPKPPTPPPHEDDDWPLNG